MIRSLAYLGFTSPATNEWRTFGPEILGAQLADDGPDGAVRMRIDGAAWRLAMHPGDANDLAYIGWDVGDHGDLSAAVGALADANVDVVSDDVDLAHARSVDQIAWFIDPFGFRHELTSGQHQAGSEFVPGRPMEGGFVTGDGGMGHLVLMVPDFDVANDFYLNTLGFNHSDDVEAGIRVRFAHCNPRHHTLAFSHVPGHIGVHHLMLEVERTDDVGRAHDIVTEREMPLAMTLGRHTNDQMFSFYVRTPSGFEVEYGAEGLLVDTAEPWEPGHYDATSTWGHKPPASPLIPEIIRKVDASA